MMEAMQRQKLIVFVKAPRPGSVKTRLAQSLGAQAACDAYRFLVDRALVQLTSLGNVELCFSPDDALDEIRPWLRTNWVAAAQGGGTLGERLIRAFRNAFADGCTSVVAIGSDCPEVTTLDLFEAWNSLETQDVVVGPASDGGYWLIGLNAPSDGIFEKIDWSTPRVFEQTMQWIRANGKSYHLLRELSDVDTEDDWKAYLKRMTKDEALMTKSE
jgi:uncharacterized protein